MEVSKVGLLRLRAQHVAGERSARPEDAVRHLLAMQAQDYAGMLWSVGLRTESATQQDVEQALAERTIVRTWPMRGTLHVLHADDVRWMTELLAPRATASAKNRRVNQLGLTDAIVDEAEAVLRAALAGGKAIPRSQIVELLKAGVKGIVIDNQHTQHLMRNFGERGVICFGPHAGRQPTFVLLDEWVPKRAEKPRGEALAELARRYFVSHGPATLKDFAGWGMLKISDAKAGLEAVKHELGETVIADTVHYHAQDMRPADPSDTYLLPGFDEFILGYKERDTVLALEHANKIVPGGNGMFLPTIIKDGHVIGLWKRRIGKQQVTFDYEYFGTENTATDVTAAEARYRAFVQGTVQ